LPEDKQKKVWVKYKDNAGNWANAINDTIELDTTPPTGSIVINDGASYTQSSTVTLKLTCTDARSGCVAMKFSNDGTTWSAEEPRALSKTWALLPEDKQKKVWVKYKDNAGNWANAINDTIELDTTPPTGTIIINGGAASTTSTTVTLTLTSTDARSGCVGMKFSNDGVNWTAEEPRASSKAWTLTSGAGVKTVYVKYKDNAGNWSNGYSDTINLL
jgi:uncharacterized protein (DUF2141 family)